MNQEQWSEGTLTEADEQIISTPQVKTPATQSTQHKEPERKLSQLQNQVKSTISYKRS